MINAFLIIGQGVEDSEAIYPFYRLQEEGYSVHTLTHNDLPITGKYGVSFEPSCSVVDMMASEINPDLIVIPGGHEGPDRVRQVPGIREIVKSGFLRGSIISSICHGPWVLVSAGIMDGLNATSYKGCKDDIINAGAVWCDDEVVVDRNVVTAQHFRSNHLWMKATIDLVRANSV